MNKTTIAFGAVAAVLVMTSALWADVYMFTPSDPNLKDLPHQSYFTWGVNWNVPTGEVITAARLTYLNIYDWTVEPDRLYTHLLDAVPDPNGSLSPNFQAAGTPGSKYAYERITIVGADNQVGGDDFARWSASDYVALIPPDPLGNTNPWWDDPYGGSPRNFSLSYDIPTDDLYMLADGSFGFGIDPDCHYFNSGIVLTIGTRPASPAVPAPAAGGLAAIGLALLAWRLLAKQA